MTWQASPAVEGVDASWQATNRVQGFRTYFTANGIRMVPRIAESPAWRWGLTLVGYGEANATLAIPAAALSPSGHQIEYRRGSLLERYENTPEGLEQFFMLSEPPRSEPAAKAMPAPSESRSSIHLDLALWGDLTPRVSEDGQAIDFLSPLGAPALHYARLGATDARGAVLPSRMEAFAENGGGIRLVVDTRDAIYPITIDPLATTFAWTAAANQQAALFGHAVATAGDVNGDGYSDVLVGAPYYDNGQPDEGRAYLYLGSPSGLATTPAWTAESNQVGAYFAYSLAPAGDVNGDGYADVIVGCWTCTDGLHLEPGAAFVYLGSATGLASTPAWTKYGDQSSASFGYAVSGAGDINGDGYSDVIVGAYAYDNGQTDEGRAYLYLGSAAGLATTPAWTAEGNQAGAVFGIAVANAGDVNADGFADVLVGASAYSNGQSGEGRAFLYLGSASGLAPTPAWTAESDQANASFGGALATAGDVNGDGYADVLVSAYAYTSTKFQEGRAYLYFGNASGLTTTPAWTTEGNQASANYGSSVATAGDVNADGYADVMIGAYNYTTTQPQEGKVFLYLGSATGPYVRPDWTATGNSDTAGFGAAVATAGDVNGDGYSDVVVGAHTYNQTVDGGRAFLFLGSGSVPSTSWGWAMTTPGVSPSQIGASVASAGDVNGDGYSDVLIGNTAFAGPAGSDLGQVSFFFGAATGPGATPDWTVTGTQAGEQLGSSVASAGDVNGDGYSDVIVGSPQYVDGGIQTGKVFVYLGSAAGLASTPAWTVEGDATHLSFGFAVASAGDVNADGYADVIVSATRSGSTSPQDVFLYLGSPSGLSTTPAWTFGGTTGLGTSIACAGDVNGDGYSDIVIGATGLDLGSGPQGGAFVFLGSAAGPPNTPSTLLTQPSTRVMGFSVASAGDVNGDGFSDVVVSGRIVTPPLVVRQVAYVYLGSPAGLATTPALQAVQGSTGTGPVASAGDVNGDGFSDLLMGVPHWTGNYPDAGGAFVYLGSAAGMTATPAWSITPFDQGALLGAAVAGAGDVNGDGLADILVGSPGDTFYGGVGALYYGGGGPGLDRIPRQVRSDDTTPIALLGRSDSHSSFHLRERGLTAAGRGKIRLQWEIKPLGTPFNGGALGTSTVHETGPHTPYGSFTSFSETIGGLADKTFYHWRTRILSQDPLFPRSPWIALAGNNVTETKLRTTGCVDLDDDGYGQANQADCLSPIADCNDSNPFAWGTPGEAQNLLFTSNTTLVWDPPATAGAPLAALLYDTLRSTQPGDFVGAAACLESDAGPDTTASDPASPAVGHGFFYLVRAQTSCPAGQGPLGYDSQGNPRVGISCP
jgi:hypothetical protein